MPNLRFDWHEHLKEVEREYHAARHAVDYLTKCAIANPSILDVSRNMRASLRGTDRNLEGTYLVRLFAAFEAALRSYDRAISSKPKRDRSASRLIDTVSGRRGQGISHNIRTAAHEVRKLRNYWAHETETLPIKLTFAEARNRLQTFLSCLPERWS